MWMGFFNGIVNGLIALLIIITTLAIFKKPNKLTQIPNKQYTGILISNTTSLFRTIVESSAFLTGVILAFSTGLISNAILIIAFGFYDLLSAITGINPKLISPQFWANRLSGKHA